MAYVALVQKKRVFPEIWLGGMKEVLPSDCQVIAISFPSTTFPVAFHLYLPTKDTMQKSKQQCIPAAQQHAAAQQYADGASQPPWLAARLAESAEPWQLNVGHWVLQEESSEKVWPDSDLEHR